MFGVPGPYGAWVAWLDAFARGEDRPCGHLVRIGEELGPHMQARLLARLADAFHERQRRWNDALVRDLAAVDGTPLSLAAALTAAKARLAPLVRLAENPLLPRELRAEIRRALTETVRSAQRSLEDSASRNPMGTDRLVGVVRENSLETALAGAPAMQRPEQARSAVPPGRRVIL